MELVYNFNNDEKTLEIEKKEYLSPKEINIYPKEGDSIYINDGSYVYINQLIKESPNGIKTYATISGDVTYQDGVIKITNDNTDSEFVSESKNDDVSILSKEEILNACKELGIDYENKSIYDKLVNNYNLIVVNAMDVEPYQFNNNYKFEENSKDLIKTIDLLSKRFNINAHLLLNKYDDNNVNKVNDLLKEYPDINFKVVEETYPYTINKIVANRLFPEKKYENILFLDTFALYKIFRALRDGLPAASRYITVIDEENNKFYVIDVKYGTSLGEVIKELLNIDLSNKDVYLNNFMRKVKCPNVDNVIISDNIKTVFIYNSSDEIVSKCIKCGKCVDICPLGINPLEKNLDPNCIRCGLCNYVCPANINLIGKEKE